MGSANEAAGSLPGRDNSDTVSISAGMAAGHTLARLAQLAGEAEGEQGLDCLHCTLPSKGWKTVDREEPQKGSPLYAAYEHVRALLHGNTFPLLLRNQSEDTLLIVRLISKEECGGRFWVCPWCTYAVETPGALHAHFERRHQEQLDCVSRVAYLRCCVNRHGTVRAFLSGPSIGRFSNPRETGSTSSRAPPARKGEQGASQSQPTPNAATAGSRRKGGPAHSSSPSPCVQLGDVEGPQMKQTDLSESPPPSWPAKRRRTPGAGTGTSATNQPDGPHSPRASAADGRRMRSLNELQVTSPPSEAVRVYNEEGYFMREEDLEERSPPGNPGPEPLSQALQEAGSASVAPAPFSTPLNQPPPHVAGKSSPGEDASMRQGSGIAGSGASAKGAGSQTTTPSKQGEAGGVSKPGKQAGGASTPASKLKAKGGVAPKTTKARKAPGSGSRKKPPSGTPQQLVSDPSVQQLLQQSQAHSGASAIQLMQQQQQQQQQGFSNGGLPHAQQQPSSSHAGGVPRTAPASSQQPSHVPNPGMGSHGGSRANSQASPHPQSPQGVPEQRALNPSGASTAGPQPWQGQSSFFPADSPFNQGPRPGLPASFVAAQQTQARPFKPTARRANPPPKGPNHPLQAALPSNHNNNHNSLHPNPQCNLHPSRQAGGNSQAHPQAHLSGFQNSPPPPFGAIPPQSAARPSSSVQAMGPLRGHPLAGTAGGMPNGGPAMGASLGSNHAAAAAGMPVGPHGAMPHPACGRHMGSGRQSGPQGPLGPLVAGIGGVMPPPGLGFYPHMGPGPMPGPQPPMPMMGTFSGGFPMSPHHGGPNAAMQPHIVPASPTMGPQAGMGAHTGMARPPSMPANSAAGPNQVSSGKCGVHVPNPPPHQQLQQQHQPQPQQLPHLMQQHQKRKQSQSQQQQQAQQAAVHALQQQQQAAANAVQQQQQVPQQQQQQQQQAASGAPQQQKQPAASSGGPAAGTAAAAGASATAAGSGVGVPRSAADLLALIQGVQSLPAGQRPERLEVDLNLGILNVYPNG